MKRTLRIFCVVVCALSFFCISNGFAGESITGRVTDWAPYYYTDNGEWNGICVDAYKALTQEAGIELVIKHLPWSRAIKYLKFMPIMVGNMTLTDERREFMYFFGPHHQEIMGLVISTKYKNEIITSLDDLAALAKRTGNTVVFKQDVFYSEEFNSRIESDPDFAINFSKKVTKISDSIRLVAEDRYLGLLEDKSGLTYVVKSKKMTDKVYVHDFVLSQSDVYLGVSKTISAGMYKKLKAADERLKKRGAYKLIQNKWISSVHF